MQRTVKDRALSTRGTGDPSLGTLSELAPELAETFVTVASDIALVVDLDGTIRSVAVGADSPTPTAASWVGRPWVDTVTASTRRKIERLLREVAVSGVSRRCEVDHLLPSGAGVPVAYSAVRLGVTGPVLAAGRDLRAIAAIQQRFVQAQQRMERDYWKRREAESRYRRLFHVATDAVLVVDGTTLEVVEGNVAAAERLGIAPDALAGRDALAAFDAASRAVVATLCAEARANGRSAEVRAWLPERVASVDVAATPFRTGDSDLLLLRLRTIVQDGPDGDDGTARLVDFVERTPDGVAITDTGGRVLSANAAFAALCGLPDAASAEGLPIDTWLDAGLRAVQPDDASVLDEVRRQGFVQRVRARLRTGDGTGVPVELSATMLADQEDAACIGFSLRHADADADLLPDSWALRARRETRALLARVGELPLPDLLQQAAALAERHFVARALALADGDGDRAAHLLGLERGALDARLGPKGPDHGAANG
ncbi:MAG: transcriptional regulator PpsR [Burkholderiales bacterium]|nr:transcriptional regulator PpsR [Burkholderiales bacterium]